MDKKTKEEFGENETSAPLPFEPLRALAEKRPRQSNYRRYLNVATVLGERIAEHDWAMVGPLCRVLTQRYHTKNWLSYHTFPREVTFGLLEALRACNDSEADSYAERLLTAAVNSPDTYATSGFAKSNRLIASIELMRQKCARGAHDEALTEAKELSILSYFHESPIYQWAIGALALHLANAEPENARRADLLLTAEESFHRAIQNDPTSSIYALQLAEVLEEQGRFQEATAALNKHAKSGDLLINEHLLRKEPDRIDLADSVLAIDPLSEEARSTVVRNGEPISMAELFASRIENGDRNSWKSLREVLSNSFSMPMMESMWEISGRSKWWPLSYFTSKRAELDFRTDPDITDAQLSIAVLLISHKASKKTKKYITGTMKLLESRRHQQQQRAPYRMFCPKLSQLLTLSNVPIRKCPGCHS